MVISTRTVDCSTTSRRTHRARGVRLALIGASLLGMFACSGAPTGAPGTPVVTPVATRVVLNVSAAQITAGLTTTLTATVRDQRDSLMLGQVIVWSTSNAAVATVGSDGLVRGLAAGTATIVATSGAAAAQAVITVVGVPSGPASEFQTSVPPIDLNVILARPTATAVTASVYSGAERDVTISWEPDGGSVVKHVVPGRATDVELTGLSADRSYSYQVTAAGAAVQGQFRTARAPGSTFRFVMQADSHLDGNSDTRIYTNTLSNMVADAPDFLVDLGDTFMTDKYPNYQDAAAQYYAQRHYLGLTGRTIPLFLVQGNHDGELGWLLTVAPWAADMRTRYFPSVNANGFYSSQLTARNYYAWSWGDATFIVLDPYAATLTQPSRAPSNWAWSLGREQYDWLQAVLQRTTTAYTFVFLHNLVGGQGSEGRGGAEASRFWEWGGLNADGSAGFATQRAGWSKPIHDLFVQYKVSAVFHGHDHLYVHQERDGIAYQEVPQPSFARENATASAADYGYLSGTLLGSSGHLRVTVTPAKATVEYVRSRLTAGNGDVVDRYDIRPASQR
jgi:hypothetical protein